MELRTLGGANFVNSIKTKQHTQKPEGWFLYPLGRFGCPTTYFCTKFFRKSLLLVRPMTYLARSKVCDAESSRNVQYSHIFCIFLESLFLSSSIKHHHLIDRPLTTSYTSTWGRRQACTHRTRPRTSIVSSTVVPATRTGSFDFSLNPQRKDRPSKNLWKLRARMLP